MDAITEILPEVYRLPLYSKFGCLYREKSLNINEIKVLEDYDETAQDKEIADERTYFIGNPLDFYVKDEKILQKRVCASRVETLRAHTGRAAVQELANMAFKNSGKSATQGLSDIALRNSDREAQQLANMAFRDINKERN